MDLTGKSHQPLCLAMLALATKWVVELWTRPTGLVLARVLAACHERLRHNFSQYVTAQVAGVEAYGTKHGSAGSEWVAAGALACRGLQGAVSRLGVVGDHRGEGQDGCPQAVCRPLVWATAGVADTVKTPYALQLGCCLHVSTCVHSVSRAGIRFLDLGTRK